MKDKTTYYIYNGNGADKICISDTESFLRQTNSSVNIYKMDFTQNLKGINPTDNPVMLVPGGQAMFIGEGVLNNCSPSYLINEHGWGYIGLCAGAFLAGDKVDLYRCKYERNDGDFSLPVHGLSEDEGAFVFKLCNTQAVGPFYPNDSYLRRSDLNTHKAYSATVSYQNRDTKLLYINGCGIDLSRDRELESVATYSDRVSYSFFKPPFGRVSYENLCAIAKRNRTAQKGPLFLSGPHIEASVGSSDILNTFTPEALHSEHTVLCEQDIRQLKDSAAGNLQSMQEEVRAVFSV